MFDGTVQNLGRPGDGVRHPSSAPSFSQLSQPSRCAADRKSRSSLRPVRVSLKHVL